jgi:hypothetical protein
MFSRAENLPLTLFAVVSRVHLVRTAGGKGRGACAHREAGERQAGRVSGGARAA